MFTRKAKPQKSSDRRNDRITRYKIRIDKVLYSVGEDEFTEVSFVQLSGSLEENLEDYYILERDI